MVTLVNITITILGITAIINTEVLQVSESGYCALQLAAIEMLAFSYYKLHSLRVVLR